MTEIIPISGNGMSLYENDLVLLTGEALIDSVVSYSHHMINMLNDKKEYTVERIIKYQLNINKEKFGVRIGGWVWDPRNITKITKNDLKKKEPIVFFNIENLDI